MHNKNILNSKQLNFTEDLYLRINHRIKAMLNNFQQSRIVHEKGTYQNFIFNDAHQNIKHVESIANNCIKPMQKRINKIQSCLDGIETRLHRSNTSGTKINLDAETKQLNKLKQTMGQISKVNQVCKAEENSDLKYAHQELNILNTWLKNWNQNHQ